MGGSGGEITVDTAGSNFDTIFGVYTWDGESFTQVGCGDDVFETGFSLQSKITWESEPGVTYYIQAGGFGFFDDQTAQYGALKIKVSG